MYRTLLVATDGSPRSTEVVSTARAVARSFGARLHLYRAVFLPPEIPAATGKADDLEKVLTQKAREDLERLSGGDPAAVVEPIETTPQQPWRLILAAAKRINADLIVIGSHGYSGWDRLLGTTAAKVSDHADRSVLVVHNGRAKSDVRKSDVKKRR